MPSRGPQEAVKYLPRDETSRGALGELVREVAGPGGLTIWMLGWRCKRCGHCWPLRQTKGAEPTGERPSKVPKRCPACDSPRWHLPFLYHRKGGHRVKTVKGRTSYGPSGKAKVTPGSPAAGGELESDASLPEGSK